MKELAYNGRHDRSMSRQIVIDPRSLSSVQVDLYAMAPPSIGLGTGFLVADGGALALVTNYHVLSGRDPETNLSIDPQARIPDRALIPLPTSIVPAAPEHVALAWAGAVWHLTDDDDTPLWCMHPTKGRAVDVAVLPLGMSTQLSHNEKCAYSMSDGKSMLTVQFGSDVAIIGFPDRVPTAAMTAIWKGGHVASEPDLDVNGQPFFWLDAAGAPGMSGSPVITRQTGPLKAIGGNVMMGRPGNMDRVLGIYSGRARSDLSLGRCWRWDVVAEVIDHAFARFRSGNLTPRRGELAVYPRPDDVRIPRIDAHGRYLTIFAAEMAKAAGDHLSQLRTGAALTAALANPDEPKSIVLARTEAIAIVNAADGGPAIPRLEPFLAALRAQLATTA